MQVIESSVKTHPTPPQSGAGTPGRGKARSEQARISAVNKLF